MNKEYRRNHRINSIDIVRWICAILIISIHTHPLEEYFPTLGYQLWILISHIATVATPYFFAIAGYFYFQRLQEGKQAFLPYIKRLLQEYALWSCLYFSLEFLQGGFHNIPVFIKNCILGFLWKGTYYHFWFFPALIYAVCMSSFLWKIGFRKRMVFLSVVLFAIGCLGSAYAVYGVRFPFLGTLYTHSYFKSVRRIFCTGFPFFVSGYLVNQMQNDWPWTRDKRYVSIFFICSMSLWVAESVVSFHKNWYWDYILTFGIYLVILSSILLLSCFPMKKAKNIARYSRFVANWTFYIHPFIIVCLYFLYGHIRGDGIPQTLLFLMTSLLSWISGTVVYFFKSRRNMKQIQSRSDINLQKEHKVNNKKRRPKQNHTLNALKGIAAIMVIFIHAPFPGIFGQLIIALARTAVALFFLISGYYMYKPRRYLVRKSLPHKIKNIASIATFAFSVYLLWESMIRLAGGGLASELAYIRGLFSGPSMISFFIFNNDTVVGHLWFLLAMLVAYILFFVIFSVGLEPPLWLGIILLGIHLIASEVMEMMGRHISLMYLRNVWLYALPVMILGYWIHRREVLIRRRFTNGMLCLGVLSGIALCFVERIYVGYLQLYFGNILILFSVFILALRYPGRKKEGRLAAFGRRYSTDIYIFHWMIMEGLGMLPKFVTPLNAPWYSWVKPVLTVIITLIGVWIFGLLKMVLSERRILFRVK